MKILFFAIVLFSMNLLSAREINYTCIANSLQALNSDIYYNLNESEIDAMLTIPEMLGHYDAINAAKRCENKSELITVACNGNLEAEFIGKVTNLNYSTPEAGNIENSTYGIGSFTFFSENTLCPLDEGIALSASFWVQGKTELKNGDSISGVLVFNPITHIFSIE